MDNISKIINEFLKTGIEITGEQAEQFVDYYTMLVETNKVMNLTAITEFNDVILKHYIDSVYCTQFFLQSPKLSTISQKNVDKNEENVDKSSDLSSKRLIDVGTGAGFPGIPIKILFPELNITLLDSLNKRLNFLNSVIEKLSLSKIETVHYRAEDGARDKALREQFDYAVSRAVANMSTLTEYCLPYVKVNGIFAAYKSGNIDDELTNAKKSIFLMGGKLERKEKYNLPNSDVNRSLVVIRKIEATSKKYPRKAGLPGKEPIIG